jgi:hypothetical protein
VHRPYNTPSDRGHDESWRENPGARLHAWSHHARGSCPRVASNIRQPLDARGVRDQNGLIPRAQSGGVVFFLFLDLPSNAGRLVGLFSFFRPRVAPGTHRIGVLRLFSDRGPLGRGGGGGGGGLSAASTASRTPPVDNQKPPSASAIGLSSPDSIIEVALAWGPAAVYPVLCLCSRRACRFAGGWSGGASTGADAEPRREGASACRAAPPLALAADDARTESARPPPPRRPRARPEASKRTHSVPTLTSSDRDSFC